MRIIRFISIILASVLINTCTTLKAPVINKYDSFEKYKYIFITPSKELTSGTGGIVGGQHGVYGFSINKTVNPVDVISGILLKEGYIRIPELKTWLLDKTIIVNYGESGKRNTGLGYTLEVTIQFISAKTHKPIGSCTAEGIGDTEADDIREAITRCLSGLLSKDK